VELLTSLPKWRVGALLIVSAINHEKAPMSQLNALKANNWTNIVQCAQPPAALKSSLDGTQYSEQHHVSIV